jgi:hypothetical protein
MLLSYYSLTHILEPVIRGVKALSPDYDTIIAMDLMLVGGLLGDDPSTRDEEASYQARRHAS